MKLIDTLQDEHVLIDQVLGYFRTYADELVNGTADPDDELSEIKSPEPKWRQIHPPQPH